MNVLDKGLPKWPALLVSGDLVSLDQAAEIIIRTSNLPHFLTNDRGFEALLNKEVFGVRATRYGDPDLQSELIKIHKFEVPGDYWSLLDQKRKEYGVLNIEYLRNSRICSCYVGGPHGWCDWSGNIGCDSYNIGKWPDCETVFKEWQLIAKTFPFLDLRCQLLDKESCEENPVPIIEYIVHKGGLVEAVEPKEMLRPVVSGGGKDFSVILNSRTERGCSIPQFRNALEIAKKSLLEKAS